MEFLGRDNHASVVGRKMGDELHGRNFVNMDEQIDAMSSAPLEDFEGKIPFLLTAHIAVIAAGYTVDTYSKSLFTTDGVVAITRSSWAEVFT